MPKNGNYEVGYGKPPKDKQFKKGQSGNPKGRPKGRKNMSTHIEEVLASKVMVRENGVSRMLPFRKVFVRNLAAKALNGTVRDMLSTMSAIETYAPQELEQKPYPDKLTVQYVLPDGKTMEDYEQDDTHACASGVDTCGSRVQEVSERGIDAAWKASGIDDDTEEAAGDYSFGNATFRYRGRSELNIGLDFLRQGSVHGVVIRGGGSSGPQPSPAGELAGPQVVGASRWARRRATGGPDATINQSQASNRQKAG